MNKTIALLLIAFLAVPCIAHSIKDFKIQETEKISLQAKATDPDANRLITTYTPPLNEKGEWQTTYGDAGDYRATITVSDGANNVSEDVSITVSKKEEPPKIESFIPSQFALSINETNSVDFRVLASDLNKDDLSYEWLVDDKKVKEGREFFYETTYKDAGNHKVSAVVSDGTLNASNEWNVNVANVNVERLLDDIRDISVNENEAARLELADFEKYGLAYSISEPLGKKNEWNTTYGDSGVYNISIHAEGKGFRGDKTVKLIVKDVDRPPVLEKIASVEANEGEEIRIALNAQDPDGDLITYSAEPLPKGALIEENIFSWTPSFDTVKKAGFFASLMRKSRASVRQFNIKFTAYSKGKKSEQSAAITVKDVNRAPVIEDMENITISEGEKLKIVPKAYDLDGDKVRIRYSGFMNKDTFKSGFGDAGTYYTKVTASDGLLETPKLVRINIKKTNRAPIFGKIKAIKAKQDDSIGIMLDARDPDGDNITYSIDNPPNGSSLNGNAFLWTPNINTVKKGETKKFDLVFAASDAKSQTRQDAMVEISYKNMPPKIINATDNLVAKINKLTTMSVKASDDDGDELTYTWSFGQFESYKATSSHQRIFTKRGVKKVKVIVSDGTDTAEHTITVSVI